MILWVFMENRSRNLHIYVLVTLFLITSGIWYAVILENPHGILTVAFLDIGQGDAIYIEAPNGNQVLIDGGGNKTVLAKLAEVMPLYDRSIDVVIGTHPDQDHIGGLPFVLEQYEVTVVLDPGVEKESGTYEALLAAMRDRDIEYVEAHRGQRIVLDDGVVLTILSPDRDLLHVETNTASVVAKLTYGKTSFLFMADVPKNVEAYLTRIDGENLDIDVLKVGHHGSHTSSGEKFLKITSPIFAAISAGKNNRYGHPHKEVLDDLAAVGATVLGTYDRGTIVLVSDGLKIGLK